jgi:hypothetical protein
MSKLRLRRESYERVYYVRDVAITGAMRARSQTTFPFWIYNSRQIGMTETEIVFSVQESPEGGYEAKALGYSIYTQAETLSDLKEALKDAVRCHFGDDDKPAITRLHLA